MTPGNPNEQELQQKAQELKRREQEIRLRELEMEVNQPEPPLYRTVKHDAPDRKKRKKWLRKLTNTGKFGLMVFGSFLVVVVTWRIAALLVPMLIVGAIAFIGYKLYLDNDDD